MSSTSLLLRKRRKTLGIKQRQVADSLNVHTMFVSNFETGKCPLPYRHLKNVLKIYNLSEKALLNALLKDEEQKIKSFID